MFIENLKKDVKKMEENGKLIGKGFAIIAFPIVVWLIISYVLSLVKFNDYNGWILAICFIGLIFAMFYSFYILWAPKGIFTVIVQPSTVMIVGFNGKPTRHLSEKGILGGWRLVGIYPFHQILPITFEKWHSMEKTKDGFKLVEHPEKVVNFISTKKYSYASEVTDAETAVSRASVRIPFIVVAQVLPENAIKFAFEIKNPISTVTSKIEVSLRNKVLNTSYDVLFHTEAEVEDSEGNKDEKNKKSKQSMIEFGQEIFDGLKDSPDDEIIKSYETDFGLTTYSIGVLDLDPKDREANRRKFEAERTREAQLIEANTDAETMVTRAKGQRTATETIAAGNANARAMEIGQSVKQIFCRITGLSEEVADFLSTNSPEEFERKYGKILRDCTENVLTTYKVDRKAFFQFKSDALSGGSFANTIAEGTFVAGIMKDIVQSRNTSPTQPSSQSPPPNSTDQKTKEERRKKVPKENSKESSFENKVKKVLAEAGLDPDKEWDRYETDEAFDEDAKNALYAAGVL